MDTKEMTREQISALADGELVDRQIDVALAALRQSDAKDDWEIYHQIGDVLRSDDMAVTLSSGFAGRMAARLDAEPTIIAPAIPAVPHRAVEQSAAATKRWALPSMVAAAAVATVAFIATPQLMVALKGGPAIGEAARIASTAPGAEQAAVVAASAPEGVVLRDPLIDDYLLAHQRFSPSVYSTAQYARSASLSNK